uniref:8-oxo-dGTP pyrophosphatase MutT, NUDIX family n=1 Tax=Candidatus Kentrum sp. FW TaxID=2126338 RepID=A0A450U1Y3_9GAMM|nr:MAG: 8-oxo-dGTP pyrophosphatase MutT, NUDIX family [Candidatus Kentron sp. FW]
MTMRSYRNFGKCFVGREWAEPHTAGFFGYGIKEPGEISSHSKWNIFNAVEYQTGNRRQPLDKSLDLPRAALIPAAVLIPIVERSSGLTMLLTKRTNHPRKHPGQITFPGGRAEETDDGPVATALRETEEEIGLGSSFIDVIGFLDAHETFTGFLVTPVVGLIGAAFQLNPDPSEVAEIIEVPISFLLDPANYYTDSCTTNGMQYGFYALKYEEQVIWGATAGMLVNLYRRMIFQT